MRAAVGRLIGQLLAAMMIWTSAAVALGVPPLPEDPALARVAPEQCLFYASWSGIGTPDPKSANQTELFLAEPEIQRVFVEIDRLILANLTKLDGSEGQQQAAMGREAYEWGKKLIKRPMAVFVSSVEMTPQGPDVRGGLIVNVGDDAGKLKAVLEKYQAAAPGGAEKVEIGKLSGYRLKLPGDAPPITWGISGKYLIAGIGQGSVEGIVQRAKAVAPAWLAALREQLPVERRSAVLYVNVKKIVEQFAPMGPPQVRTVIEALGLGNVTSTSVVAGLDGEGFLTRTLIGIDGEAAGILGFAGEKPLTVKDLAPIPRDANLAMAARVDAARVLETVLAVAGKIEPQAPEEINRNLKELSERLGVDVRKDVLGSLGDVWCMYNSADEGGLILTGATAVVQVKDHERLSAAHAKLLTFAKNMLGQDGDRPGKKAKAARSKAEEEELEEEAARPASYQQPRARIEHFQFAGQEVYYLSFGAEIPFAPAWCLTSKELIVSLMPQPIKAYLSRGEDFRSLAAVPQVAEEFKAEGPLGLWYMDSRPILNYFYPGACMAAQMFGRQVRSAGVDLNALIPSAPSIYRHLRPDVAVVRRTKAGVEMTSRGSLPIGVASPSPPVLVGLLLPAVQSARSAARRAQSMNNLKQIGLGMHNYASASGSDSFPPAYIADKTTGKPLLSWRVAILPYLEEQPLYDQFHLDEPWDSEHNKKLIARMPQTYRSPASGAAPGKTNYLTVRGKDTAFPGKDAVSLAGITDGTSRTIMVVEASDAKAVPWTKPDDFEYNPDRPTAGLLGLWPGGFLAALCDGSVQFFSSTVDAEVLRAMYTRNGREAVDQSEIDGSPRRKPR